VNGGGRSQSLTGFQRGVEGMHTRKSLLLAGSRVVRIVLAVVAVATVLFVDGCDKRGGPVGVNPSGCFPVSHEHARWSSQGLIAYKDNGIVFPLLADGICYVDFSLYGIWVLDPETGESERVFEEHQHCDWPAWSPDGEQLAVSMGWIYTMNADGTDLTQLPAGGSCLDWSPDGDRIAWCNMSGVWVMPSSGENPELVLPLAADYPNWHPTEEILLCSGWMDSFVHSGIFEYDLLTESVTAIRISADGNTPSQPRYSPDGSQIAFCGMEMPEAEVWVMDADGSNARQLTWEGGSHPSWSPDGTRLVYTREIWDHWEAGASEDGVLWVVDVESGEREQLTFQWWVDEQPRAAGRLPECR